MPTKLVIDCSTGETTEVELTKDEIKQQEKDRQEWALAQAERDAQIQAKTDALAKLKTLGLTDAEIQALFA